MQQPRPLGRGQRGIPLPPQLNAGSRARADEGSEWRRAVTRGVRRVYAVRPPLDTKRKSGVTVIRPRQFWLALLPASVLPVSAIAQVVQLQAPNENELHSAYCVSLLKLQIQFFQNGLTQAEASAKNPTTPSTPGLQELTAKARTEMRENLAKLGAARDRLQAYLLPKMMKLDSAALALAMKRGEADWQAFRVMGDRCGATCSPAKQSSACWSSCVDTALIDRIRACASPTWLPF